MLASLVNTWVLAPTAAPAGPRYGDHSVVTSRHSGGYCVAAVGVFCGDVSKHRNETAEVHLQHGAKLSTDKRVRRAELIQEIGAGCADYIVEIVILRQSHDLRSRQGVHLKHAVIATRSSKHQVGFKVVEFARGREGAPSGD